MMPNSATAREKPARSVNITAQVSPNRSRNPPVDFAHVRFRLTAALVDLPPEPCLASLSRYVRHPPRIHALAVDV